MRKKRIVGPHRAEAGGESEQNWIDLEQIATVELTSEHPSFELNRHSVRGLGRAGALLRKVHSRSGSYLMNRCRCIGYTFDSMRPSGERTL